MSKSNQKKAIVTSVFALVLCFAMLLGTTFAWFTDKASTGVNTIASGTLDMVLEYWDGTAWANVDPDTQLFTNASGLEPGAVQVAYVRVKNAGDLAFKYKLNVFFGNEVAGVNVAGESFKLSEYISTRAVAMSGDFAVYADRAAAIAAAEAAGESAVSAEGNLDPNATSAAIALIVYMPSTVGNAANHNGTDKPSLEIGVNAVATQYTKEEDSFDDQYDASAGFEEPAALPTPTVSQIPGGTLSNVNNDTNNNPPFDVGLKFVANDEDMLDFGDYLCDFRLTFNQDLTGTNNVFLYGAYGTYGTLGSDAKDVNFVANEGKYVIAEFLSAMMGSNVEVPYSMVIEDVKEFNCYLHVKNPTPGLTVTLQLVMTPPATAENPNPETIEIYSFTYEY